MGVHIDDPSELDEDRPRPLDPALVDERRFKRLRRGQGTVRPQRRSNQIEGKGLLSALPKDRRARIAMLVVVVLVVVGIVVSVLGLFGSLAARPATSAQVEQTWVPVDQGVTYRGSTYALAKNDGGYVLTETSESSGGKPTVLGELHGTPVVLVLYDGALIVPENLADGTWDVAAYTIGSGWSKLVGQDGTPKGGQGTISAARLEDKALRLVIDGSTEDVPLTW